jgi:dihydroneopterin aldolase
MNDEIFMENVEIFATHGVSAAERTKLQRFLLSIRAEFDGSAAKISDEIEHTVNYESLLNTAISAVKNSSFNLIERLAQHVADAVFEKFPPITSLRVTIKKFPDDLAQINFAELGFSSTFVREGK